MNDAILEDQVAEAFEKRGYIVFKRRNHCDVLAVKPDFSPKTYSSTLQASS